MHLIDGPGATEQGRFTEGDPVIPIPATEVTADWLNAVQDELQAVLTAAGISPDKADNAQLVQAIKALIIARFVGRRIIAVAPLAGTGDLNSDVVLRLPLKPGSGLVVSPGSEEAETSLDLDPSAWDAHLIEVIQDAIDVPHWLAGHRTFFVSPDGDDALAASRDNPDYPFKTVQGAVNRISSKYNLGIYTATVSIAAGEYAPVSLPKYNSSGGTVRLVGAGTGTVIKSVNNFLINGITSSGSWSLENMAMQVTRGATTSAIGGIYASQGSLIALKDVAFTATETAAGANLHVIWSAGGTINIYTVSIVANGLASGSSMMPLVSSSYGMLSQHSDMAIGGRFNTCCYVANANFNRNSGIRPIITGSCTGRRYLVESNGVIAVVGGGAYYFPGTDAGYAAAETGGRYV
ncbi:hypothetical protein LJC46_02050 [Desulfovibrio sp. OttesenSCG-928-G15]|nr:hypothetical protein [Desulfovibrio sp. OttesenSCG-928-G15]